MLQSDSAERVLLAARRLQYELNAARVLKALGRLIEVLRKANFDPNQPRVPAGDPDGGQWTSVGGGEGGSDLASPPVIRISDEVPLGDPPEIPRDRPSVPETRNRIIREAAKWLWRLSRAGGPVGLFVEYLEETWVRTDLNEIEAYLDEPKSLEDLNRDVASPKKGYNIHHIIEQTSARQDGHSEEKINAAENLVRIPTLIHREITAWYNTKTDDFGGLSPRDYLRGKSWEERRDLGLRKLVEFGVLKP